MIYEYARYFYAFVLLLMAQETMHSREHLLVWALATGVIALPLLIYLAAMCIRMPTVLRARRLLKRAPRDQNLDLRGLLDKILAGDWINAEIRLSRAANQTAGTSWGQEVAALARICKQRAVAKWGELPPL